MTNITKHINFTSKLAGRFNCDMEFNSAFPDHISDNKIDGSNIDARDLSSSSRLRGWGSAESRKSYACLTSLVSMSMIPARQSEPIVGEEWGYFVDTYNRS